jgi:hypothetical protein
MRDGVSFDNAYLGHMASETVISHNVITSGQLPRDMGWADEAYRDTDNVLGVAHDSMWISGSLTRDQFNALIAHGNYPKLADYLHAAHPGTKFIAAGQKNYAVFSSNGPTGDISVTFSSRNFDCDGDGTCRNPDRLLRRRRRLARLPRPIALGRHPAHRPAGHGHPIAAGPGRARGDAAAPPWPLTRWPALAGTDRGGHHGC